MIKMLQGKYRWVWVAALGTLTIAGCGRSSKTIVVGTKNSTEQMIIGEIVAQHLEHRLGHPIQRRFGLGPTLIAYQAFQSGEISLYPEYAGAIETEILREQPASDSALIFERVRREMGRVAQAELLPPLGINNTFIPVIRSDDPRAANVSTITEASQVNQGWKIATSFEFQQRSDGLPALNRYHLPMLAPIRSVEPTSLYKTLEQGEATMIMANLTDGLLASDRFKAIKDDRNVFTPEQACLLVKQNVIQNEPKLATALSELSGKFTNEKMRQMASQVDLDHRTAAEVAAEFLKTAGLQTP